MLTMHDWKIGAKKFDPYVTDEELEKEFHAVDGSDVHSKYTPSLFFDKFKILWANAIKRQELNLNLNKTPGFKEFYNNDKEPKD